MKLYYILLNITKVTLYCRYLFPLAILIIMLFIGCKKFVEIPIPKNQLGTVAVFEDSSGANSAIVGIYVEMQGFSLGILNGGTTVYTGMSSDELFTTLPSSGIRDFFNNSLIATNAVNNGDLWSRAYKIIYDINACIEGLSNTTTISNSTKKLFTAECKFLRSLVYFNLVNLYGPVPIITATNYKTNKLIPRGSEDSVYKLIVSDLLEAKIDLPTDYISSGRVRPNKYAASSFLSKVYLYGKDWNNAEIESSNVINSGIYSLESDLNNVFTVNSNETIWEMETVITDFETYEATTFIPLIPSRRPSYPITSQLLNSFEVGDYRSVIGNWINKNVSGGITYYWPFKYKIRSNFSPTTPPENYVFFRLAEQYLIRAESRVQLDKLLGTSGAESDLNEIRARANLLPVTATTKEQFITAVESERRAELFCENGNRWFDLKRWSKATLVLSSIKASWQSTDVLYPIPTNEIRNNSALTQNLGYN